MYHILACFYFPVDEETNVLITPDWYQYLLIGFSVLTAYIFHRLGKPLDGNPQPSQQPQYHQPEPPKQINPEFVLRDVDLMQGREFEYWCAALLRRLGFRHIVVTPGSNDQGADILAEINGKTFAIQCKCYAQNLGNTPIQEVEAGRQFYGKQFGAVMTNRHFTKGARALAQRTRTFLWDRDVLANMIRTSWPA